MGGGLYLSIVKKTWRLVAGLLFLLALSSIFPVPSNSGVQLEIRNVSYALKIDHPKRRITVAQSSTAHFPAGHK